MLTSVSYRLGLVDAGSKAPVERLTRPSEPMACEEMGPLNQSGALAPRVAVVPPTKLSVTLKFAGPAPAVSRMLNDLNAAGLARVSVPLWPADRNRSLL